MRRITLRGQLARQGFLLLVGAFVLLPIWVLILMATDGSIIGYPDGFHPIPVQPTLDRFAEALARPSHDLDFLGLLRNSLFVAGSSAIVSLDLRGDDGLRLRPAPVPGQRRRAGGASCSGRSCRRSRSPCRCS